MIKYIYTITDPRTGKVFYVGASVNVEQRAKNHVNSPIITTITPIMNELRSKNKRPIFNIVDSTTGDWRSLERKWIIDLKNQGHPLVNRNVKGYLLSDPGFDLIDLDGKLKEFNCI